MLEQLPVLKPDRYSASDLSFLQERVLKITAVSEKMTHWANYLGGKVEESSNEIPKIQSEIDAFFAYKYGASREDLNYMLKPSSSKIGIEGVENFDVLERKEIKTFGEYRTQRLVLEAWDRLFGS